jgi:hypothetical protein
MNINEAAQYLGVPANQLQSWVWMGGGPETIGKRRYNRVEFDKKSLDTWLSENQHMGRYVGEGALTKTED